jgi:alpha-L-fucosidase
MLEPESLTDAWEECRGIGESFGFNRNETLAEYSSSQELILMLVDVVSNGGNLLLNVGPTADGRIPIFMQERLLDIGNWLEINGEAIYGTTKYKVTTQWSEGQRRDIHPNDLAEPIVDGVAERKYILDNFNILKLTVNPEEGQAVKEIMFTRKVNTIYGIMPKFPRETLIIKHVKPTEKTEVILLGTEISLKWNYEDGIMYVDVPTNVVFDLPFQYAYTFKLTNMD